MGEVGARPTLTRNCERLCGEHAALREPGYPPLSAGPPVSPVWEAALVRSTTGPRGPGADGGSFDDAHSSRARVHRRARARCSVQFVGRARGRDRSASAAAVEWLKTMQQSDGGFEQTPFFPGFETTDVVGAIAGSAQTGPTWSTTEARTAVESLHFGGTPSGKTPIDYLVDLTANAADQGVPAKNLVLVALPLGLDPSDFGGVDLVDRMGGCDGDQTLGFNGLMWLVIAQEVVCGDAPAGNIAAIREGQQANGG